MIPEVSEAVHVYKCLDLFLPPEKTLSEGLTALRHFPGTSQLKDRFRCCCCSCCCCFIFIFHVAFALRYQKPHTHTILPPLSGFDEFNFKIGGVLLFLNTFGTEILAALALPMLAAAVANKNSPSSDRDESEKTCHQQQEQEQGEQGFLLDEEFFEGVTTEHGVRRRRRNVVGGAGAGTQVEQPEAYREAFGETSHPRGEATSGSTSPLSGRHHSGDGGRRGDEAHETALHPASSSSSAEAFLSAMERISGLVLALSSARTFLSAANISVQRGHLMLWAVFAPKFVFDATMQAVCGAAAVATWAVVLVVHRAFYS